MDLLRERAEGLPEKSLFAFLADDDDRGVTSLSRGELDRRARALAVKLAECGKTGGRALLLFPPGLDFVTSFFGCLYAGVVAVPADLPRLNRPMTRLRSIVESAQPNVLLTGAAQAKDSALWDAGVAELCGVDRVFADIGPDEVATLAGRWRDPGLDGATLAFLQYTSGSTARPKGVKITHGNLLDNSARIYASFGADSESRGVFWLPLFHDMGLIGGVIQTVYCGGSSTLFSPVAFLQRPARWLETISSTRATVSGGPNFAYELCVRKVRDDECKKLDLSRWEVAFTGAERIRAETIERFAEKFAPCGFRREAFFPCYGLAEGTLMAAGGPRLSAPKIFAIKRDELERNQIVEAKPGDIGPRRYVGCGQELPGQEIVITDPVGRRAVDPALVGEIWLRGPSVAGGYYGLPEATQRAFNAYLESGEGPFLRTGDLGFLRDGQLFVTGRLKDVIIIRGRNFYPEDIEQTASAAHSAFRPESCAAFSIDVDDREQLVVVQEVEPRVRELDTELALRSIRRAVAAEHELEVFGIALAKAGELSKTSSGKIQRSACRERYLNGEISLFANWQASGETTDASPAELVAGTVQRVVSEEEAQAWLIDRIAARIGMPQEQIQVATPFLDFGLGSLDAVEIAAELELWLGRRVSPTVVYNYPSIAALARWLSAPPVEIEAVPHWHAETSGQVDVAPESLLEDVRNMSDEEIQVFLVQEMAKL